MLFFISSRSWKCILRLQRCNVSHCMLHVLWFPVPSDFVIGGCHRERWRKMTPISHCYSWIFMIFTLATMVFHRLWRVRGLVVNLSDLCLTKRLCSFLIVEIPISERKMKQQVVVSLMLFSHRRSQMHTLVLMIILTDIISCFLQLFPVFYLAGILLKNIWKYLKVNQPHTSDSKYDGVRFTHWWACTQIELEVNLL